MPYSSEKEMYPEVVEWLQRYLRDRYRRAEVTVIDTSSRSLVRVIADQAFEAALPLQSASWDIHVDVVGFIASRTEVSLAFVECKLYEITLKDVAQLLGYSVVAKPKHAFIISPAGPSGSLRSLLKTYNRIDILRYQHEQGAIPWSMVVARWSEETRSIDRSSVIADDRSRLGRLS